MKKAPQLYKTLRVTKETYDKLLRLKYQQDNRPLVSIIGELVSKAA